MSVIDSEFDRAPGGPVALDRLLSVEPSGVMRDTFVGAGRDYGPLRIYGGHLLGQALAAAFATVPSHMLAHSLHAYFQKTGAPDTAIGYRVERLRAAHTPGNAGAAVHGGARFSPTAP